MSPQWNAPGRVRLSRNVREGWLGVAGLVGLVGLVVVLGDSDGCWWQWWVAVMVVGYGVVVV